MSGMISGKAANRFAADIDNADPKSHSEARMVIDRLQAEEFSDVARDLEKSLGQGFTVEARKAWKGYGLTLNIPPHLRGG
jgi:hypothetical protein